VPPPITDAHTNPLARRGILQVREIHSEGRGIAMRTTLLVMVAAAAAALTPVLTAAQGLPDVVWVAADGHSHTAEGVAYAPDGSFVASGGNYSDCTVRLWRAADGVLLDSFSVYPHGIESVDIAPDKPLIAVGYVVSDYPPGGVAAVWNTDTDEELFTAGGCHVALSPDGSVLASGGGGVNRYLDITQVRDGVERHSLYTGSYILDVAYSPDSQLVATAGSDNAVKLWDPATGDLVRTLAGHTDDVSAVAFSPDGSLIASGAGGWDEPSDSSIRIWRVSDGQLLDTLDGHGEWVYALAFAPAGDVVVSSGRTGPTPKIKFWDLVTGEMTVYYDESALDLDFSPDGAFLVYGRAGGDVVVARSGLTTGTADPVETAAMPAFTPPRPNPLRSQTRLSFDLSRAGEVLLEVFDVRGRRVAVLVDAWLPAGPHEISWDARAADGRLVPSGVYFARLPASESSRTQKLVVLD
jgi:hypothetical protein